ncbi:hypothetical protein C8R45DRAFT_1017355 [Mycena sanguinolenta]|nr:hypothetical protein C8R45DRAFT_1017355 [Mycena sanguinolenta]
MVPRWFKTKRVTAVFISMRKTSLALTFWRFPPPLCIPTNLMSISVFELYLLRWWLWCRLTTYINCGGSGWVFKELCSMHMLLG